jgi:hypothetical protein
MATTSGADRIGQPAVGWLTCGVLAPLVYIGSDIAASLLYPGYSFAEQAPSELFAIGAPTSTLVVPLFSLSSALYVALAIGIWRRAGGRRPLQILALLVAANGIDSLALWTLFPMHMRGVTPTFTDEMHLILAINPFVLLSLVVGVATFRDWFRGYSIATILILFALASIAFSYVPAANANLPTPWLGLTERTAQYAHQLWHAVLAIMLLKRQDVAGVA